MRERRSGKATVERHWRTALLGRKRSQNSVLALGRLISFGFRKERHQACSSDVPLTSTPTTTISTPGRPCFSLAVQVERSTSTLRYDISRLRNSASHVSAHAIHAHADCSPMHRSTAAEPSCARCKQSARPATPMTIGPHCMRRQPHDLLSWAYQFHFRSSFNCGGTTDGAELRTCARTGSDDRYSITQSAPSRNDSRSVMNSRRLIWVSFGKPRPAQALGEAGTVLRPPERRSHSFKIG
jgi:hypothetical protein